MGRSTKPTAWPEPRRDRNGRIISWRAQWEMDKARGGPVATGPSKAYCRQVCQELVNLMWGRKLKPGDDAAAVLWPPKTGRSWDDLVTEYRKAAPNSAAATWGNFMAPAAKDFGRFIKNKAVADIAPKDCLDFQAWLRGDGIVAKERHLKARRVVGQAERFKDKKAGKEPADPILGPSTIAMRGRAITTLLYFAKDVLRWAADNAATMVDWPKPGPQGQLLTDDYLGALRPYAQAYVRNGKSVWDVLQVELAVGMRVGAICGIDGRQVNKDKRTVTVAKPSRVGARGHSHLKTEGKKERIVPIAGRIWHLFADAPATGKVFAGWTSNEVGKKLRDACDEAGLPRMKSHWAKHTFITRYLEAGGNIKKCAAITGNSVASLMIYIHHEEQVGHAEVERVTYDLPAASHQPTHQKEGRPA